MRNFLDGVSADAFDPENDDTIEMVFTESAMQMLSQAAAPTEQPRPSPYPASKAPEELTLPEVRGPKAEVIPKVGAKPEVAALPEVPAVPQARPIPEVAAVPEVRSPEVRTPPEARAISGEPVPRLAMSTPRLVLLLTSVAVASALVTAVTYFAMTRPGRPAPVATSVVSIPPAPVTVAPPPPASGLAPAPASAPASAPEPPSDAATPPEPVRYVNPFDKKEVFEFPAGTSKAEARDAVAELLYERAQERQLSARGMVSGIGVRHTTGATAAAAPAARKAAP
jgi:hypothetical protein